jgi:phytoene desaturase (3,4-didehydrolycopene-forming)
MPHALVIGAGLGGLATAARLARAGYRVTLLEKDPMAGGAVGGSRRDRTGSILEQRCT